jgi:uncharacterized delta-60 repeat protein
MRGQLLVSTTNFDQTSGDFLDIYVNNVINKRLYLTSFNLYSCPLSVGDVVRIELTDVSPLITSFLNLIRRDYTTDDEGGNNGITDTTIAIGVPDTSYTFTATTVNSAYDFEYRLENTLVAAPTATPTPTPTPTPLPCLNIGTGLDARIRTIKLQSDNKILGSGDFTSYDGNTTNRIVRLYTYGVIDNTFSIGTGFNSTVLTTVIQSDGKILAGGFFTSYSGDSRNRIIRLNTDGSIDSSFIMGIGFNNTVETIAIQSDGKILTGGQSANYNGSTASYIRRLNTDGTNDTSFNFGTGFNGVVQTITIQSDGKILVGGNNFTSYNGTSTNRIIRLNTDGSVDTSFSYGSGFDAIVESIVVQPDAKILIGGWFTTYNGNSRNYIIRLNSDGSVDSSFSIGTGFNSIVNHIELQSDNKILVGGFFTSYNGTSRNRIIRLNTDGSVNTSFSIGSGFNNTVFAIQPQPDGKIIVGGDFTSYNGLTSNRIIRLNSDGTEDNCP